MAVRASAGRARYTDPSVDAITRPKSRDPDRSEPGPRGRTSPHRAPAARRIRVTPPRRVLGRRRGAAPDGSRTSRPSAPERPRTSRVEGRSPAKDRLLRAIGAGVFADTPPASSPYRSPVVFSAGSVPATSTVPRRHGRPLLVGCTTVRGEIEELVLMVDRVRWNGSPREEVEFDRVGRHESVRPFAVAFGGFTTAERSVRTCRRTHSLGDPCAPASKWP